jgi:hypothetical protein
MTSSNNPNKVTSQVLNQMAIEGVDKYYAHVKSLAVAGTTYTPADLKAVLQAEIDASKALDQSRAQVKQQVVATRLARSKGRVTRAGLKAYILGTAGSDAVQMIEDFGMNVPKKPGVKTAKAKALAADAAEATRKAKKEALASIDAAAPTPPTATPAVAAPGKAN